MLDREGKREKILEGKLREIRIKLKKQQEQQEFALRQAEKATDEIKDEPEVKLALSRSEFNFDVSVVTWDKLPLFIPSAELIEDAEREFHDATEEEVQRRIKDQTKSDPEEHEGKSGQKKKRNKSRKVETQEVTGQQQGENATQKDENGQQQNESASVAKATPAVKKSSFAELWKCIESWFACYLDAFCWKIFKIQLSWLHRASFGCTENSENFNWKILSLVQTFPPHMKMWNDISRPIFAQNKHTETFTISTISWLYIVCPHKTV